VVQAVRCDHKSASAKGNHHFHRMGWQHVSKPCCSGYAAQAEEHQEKDESPSVLAKTDYQCDSAKQSHKQCETAVYAFLGGQEVRRNC
jgi:hypothetical protein